MLLDSVGLGDRKCLEAVVEVFEAAEAYGCAADKLLGWLASKLDKQVQSIESKIKKQVCCSVP